MLELVALRRSSVDLARMELRVRRQPPVVSTSGSCTAYLWTGCGTTRTASPQLRG
jgi:hypothetical protein